MTALLMMVFGFFSGCQTPEVMPTATPTRTPIIPTSTPTLTPTLTPTFTPTSTPTPTPTLPPNLVLPPVPQAANNWFPLPTDLTFLRNGRINIWLAEGSHLEIPLLSEDSNTSIHSYNVTPDGRYIAYVTSTGKLYRLDRATWEHVFIPTSGYLIENNNSLLHMTFNGEKMFYLAWGTQPSTASSPQSAAPSGTILEINMLNPQSKQGVVGFCQGKDKIICTSIALSPDESQIAYIDGEGGWLAPTDRLKPYYLTPHNTDAVYTNASWSPDSRWLVLSSGSSQVTLFDTHNADIIPIPLKLCDEPCTLSMSWVSNTLWFLVLDAYQACLIEIDPNNLYIDAEKNQLNILNSLCQFDGWNLHPITLQTFRDNRIFFLNQGCEQPCDGLASGVYVRNADNTILPIALNQDVDGTIIWAPDGSAFHFVSSDRQKQQIGILNPPANWDVTNLLHNATDFHWGGAAVTSE